MSFTNLINGDKPVLVDFSAEWCGPCKMMAPVLKDIAHKYDEKLRVIKVDVDRNASASQVYNIVSVPTLILFRNGKVLWRQSGAMPLNELAKIIEQYL